MHQLHLNVNRADRPHGRLPQTIRPARNPDNVHFALQGGPQRTAGGPYHDWMDWTPFSYPFNLAQQPAASLPCGLSDQGLPVGLHLVAGKYQDMKVVHVVLMLEGGVAEVGAAHRLNIATVASGVNAGGRGVI